MKQNGGTKISNTSLDLSIDPREMRINQMQVNQAVVWTEQDPKTEKVRLRQGKLIAFSPSGKVWLEVDITRWRRGIAHLSKEILQLTVDKIRPLKTE